MATVKLINGAGTTTLLIGDTPADVDGDIFRLTSLDGWEGENVEQHLFGKPTGGAVVTISKKRDKPLLIRGTAVATTTGGTWRLRKKIENAADCVTARGRLVVYDSTGTGEVRVYRPFPPRVRPLGPFGIEFEITLMAPDPTKYAEGAAP